jgi:prepilin-type N-terminal cleavage/methylation domain-containing protein
MARRTDRTGEGGFTMIEVIVSLGLISVLMASLTAYFVNTQKVSTYQAQIQAATLLDPPDVVRRTIARAVTDTVGVVQHDPVNQPGITNLLEILTALTGETPGPYTSYGDLKRDVTDAVQAALTPIRTRYAELASDPGYVTGVLADGRDRVRGTAQATVRRARAALGLLS